ncbi:efflux RND transporter periplasmic adaptor subunit [Pelagovum pacificum]|uniref:Efflux RND transporter periplasmic adaptor subunit n=1 Tax=Pelagovum pacificum TaxID=2588711 RepID=A0A5C5GCQ4_9RHOB|nr:efflux RND transporter periplasmic adaptor subunit [Pelagovum pacificum]QQA44434.1 efflux RND transporter periplasmic adaptor subunit [Pelagovum pacificum]TNY32448.1 efflux RND transporter periplasmic adaptor subunit [Pelagovum pacificum]
MRLMPIISAILVTVALYFIIVQRDQLMAFARGETVEEVQAKTAADEATAEDDGGLVTDGEIEIGRVKVVALASQTQTIDDAVVLRGRTEAARTVEVRAETSGQVISEPLPKGSTVEEGDVLCELDPGTRTASLEEAQGRLAEARARLPESRARIPEAEAGRAEAESRVAEAEARVAEARARLSEAQINYNAASRLSEDGYTSETQLANAEAALESARASVSSAQATLVAASAGVASAEAGIEGAQAGVEGAQATIQSAQASVAAAEREITRLTITAPFGGLTETDTAERGSLVQVGGLCATIIQLEPIRLVGFVPEANVSKIHIGATAGARLSSGQDVRGEVTFVSRSADEMTRTFRIEVTVPNEDLSISDGETAEILIQADGRDAHLVPQSALTLNDEGELGVRTVADDRTALFMPARMVRDSADGVWLTGLPDQVDIIVVGQEYVTDGVPVEPTYREADG